MGVVFRQSVKTTIVTFTGALLGALIVYASVHIFTKAQYGFTKNLINIGAVFQLAVLLGIHNTLVTFVSRYEVYDKKKKVLLALGFIIPAIVTLSISILYVVFKEKILHIYQEQDIVMMRTYFLWVPVMVLIWSYVSMLEFYLVSQVKVAIPAFAKEILLRLGNIVFIILYYYKVISFSGFVASSVLSYIIPLSVLWFVSARTKGFGISFDWKVFSRKEYYEIIHFSWYHLLLGISANLMGYIDSLMLGPLDKEGFSSLAVYSTAIYIISIMTIPARAMSMTSFPILNEAYIAGDKAKVKDLFKRSSINILIVAMAMFLLIACNLKNAVAILPKGYEGIAPIVLILMVGRIIDMATGMNSELTSISNLYKFNLRVSLLLLLMVIVFDRLLIPSYSYYGAALGATLAFAIYNIIKMIFLWVKMGIQPFSAKTTWVLLAAGISFLAGYFLPFIYNPYIDAICRSIITCLAYVILLFWFKPSVDLTTYLISIKANKKLF